MVESLAVLGGTHFRRALVFGERGHVPELAVRVVSSVLRLRQLCGWSIFCTPRAQGSWITRLQQAQGKTPEQTSR